MSLRFFIDLILPVDSAPNRNAYQENTLGENVSRCILLTTLSHSRADCLEIWKPQPPGTLEVYPGLSRGSFTLLTYIIYMVL